MVQQTQERDSDQQHKSLDHIAIPPVNEIRVMTNVEENENDT
jgi:hypothetical protein